MPATLRAGRPRYPVPIPRGPNPEIRSTKSEARNPKQIRSTKSETNPKPEARNPKQIRSTKSETNPKSETPGLGARLTILLEAPCFSSYAVTLEIARSLFSLWADSCLAAIRLKSEQRTPWNPPTRLCRSNGGVRNSGHTLKFGPQTRSLILSPCLPAPCFVLHFSAFILPPSCSPPGP